MVYQRHLTTRSLSIERTDWPKLHDMSKACDANTSLRQFPVGVCALYLLFSDIYSRCCFPYRKQMRYWSKTYLAALLIRSRHKLRWKNNIQSDALMHFPAQIQTNSVIEQQDMFYYKTPKGPSVAKSGTSFQNILVEGVHFPSFAILNVNIRSKNVIRNHRW